MKKDIHGFMLALIISIFPLFNMVRWIFISSNASKSFLEVKNEYLSFYTGFLQNAFLLTVVNIILFIISCVIFYQLQASSKVGRASRICMIIGILLIAWQLFSLM